MSSGVLHCLWHLDKADQDFFVSYGKKLSNLRSLLRFLSIRLGNGGAGAVYLCLQQGGGLVVVKQPLSSSMDDNIKKELSIYRILGDEDGSGDQNVAACLGELTSGPGLVLEYCALGSIQDCIVLKPELSVTHVRNIFMCFYFNLETIMKSHCVILYAQCICILIQILRAVKCLNAKRVVNGDIKPENVLLNAHGCVKVADFDAAYQVNTHPASSAGTPAFRPPEQTRIPGKSDMFSAAATMIAMLSTFLSMYVMGNRVCSTNMLFLILVQFISFFPFFSLQPEVLILG